MKQSENLILLQTIDGAMLECQRAYIAKYRQLRALRRELVNALTLDEIKDLENFQLAVAVKQVMDSEGVSFAEVMHGLGFTSKQAYKLRKKFGSTLKYFNLVNQAMLNKSEAQRLTDSYLRRLITRATGLAPEDVSDDMLTLKKNQVHIVRYLRKAKGVLNESA